MPSWPQRPRAWNGATFVVVMAEDEEEKATTTQQEQKGENTKARKEKEKARRATRINGGTIPTRAKETNGRRSKIQSRTNE